MRFIAQPLNKIEHRVARLKLERLPSRQEERLHAGVAIRAFGYRHQRNVHNSESGERFLRCRELSPAAVDDDEIGPRGITIAITRLGKIDGCGDLDGWSDIDGCSDLGV